MKITKTLKIEIGQSDVEQAIKDMIQREDPSITVDSIEFTQRRNPTRLDVDVDAHYGNTTIQEEISYGSDDDIASNNCPMQDDTSKSVGDAFNEESNEETQTMEEEPEESDVEDDTQPQSIAEIFGG